MTREPIEKRALLRFGTVGVQCLSDKAMLEYIATDIAGDLYEVNTGIHTIGEMLEIADRPDEYIIAQHGENLCNGLNMLQAIWYNFARRCRYMTMLYKRFKYLLPHPIPDDMKKMLLVNNDPYSVGIDTDCGCKKCTAERDDGATSKVHKGHALQNAPSSVARN